MSELGDIEVYVSGCSKESLLLWIERATGPIGAPEFLVPVQAVRPSLKSSL